MNSPPKVSGTLTTVILIAVFGFALPQPERVRCDAVLGKVAAPAQVGVDSVRRLIAPRGRVPAEPACTEAKDALRQCFEAKQRRVLGIAPCPEPHADATDVLLYRRAVDLATRKRYAPLCEFVSASLVAAHAHLFTDVMTLGCGSRDGVRPGCAGFTPQGHLIGIVEETSVLTCSMAPIWARRLQLHCDVVGPYGVQGVLAGAWTGNVPPALAGTVGLVELQVTTRDTIPPLDALVVTSVSAAGPCQGRIPGGLPVGTVVGSESTEEGYVRTIVRLWAQSVLPAVLVATMRQRTWGGSDECDSFAALVRYRSELHRLLALEMAYIPPSLLLFKQLRIASMPAIDVTPIAFAVHSRAHPTFYETVQPVAPFCMGLRSGLACVQNGCLVGVLVEDEDADGALRLRLLTSLNMAIRVQVIQRDGSRSFALLAAVLGEASRTAVPQGWCLEGEPRLQLVGLENAGHSVVLPAEVVTAAGGEFDLPAGIRVGQLVSSRGAAFAPSWEVQPYAEFSVLDYCIALIPPPVLAGVKASGIQ